MNLSQQKIRTSKVLEQKTFENMYKYIFAVTIENIVFHKL